MPSLWSFIAPALALGEVLVPLPSGGQVALSTRGDGAFRLRLDAAAPALESPCVAHDGSDTAFWELATSRGRGVAAAFGALLVAPDSRLLLLDTADVVLTESQPLGQAHTLSLLARGGKVYGGGSSVAEGLQPASERVVPTVANLESYVPYYYSPGDGYAALGLSDVTGPGVPDAGVLRNEAKAHMHVMYEAGQGNVTWWYRGTFELYLMPARSWEEATRAFFGLVGAPRVPPLYAFGFIASRWGWESRADIESVLSSFRQGSFPIDAFVVDFEWFTAFNDYDLGSGGSELYGDFGWNGLLFPSPKEQLSAYRRDFQVRMGGIRKPRLGSSALLAEARRQGLLADAQLLRGPRGILERWLNFSQAATRAWYGQQLLPQLEAGVDFWWNDEGEAQYYAFHLWNEAEAAAQERARPGRRFFSLNRAFTPGMARLGAAVWTGDVDHSWQELQRTPGTVLKWALAGAPYVACDIGGFLPGAKEDGELLVRWYQLGAFLPLMRVHSTKAARPRFPWLWPQAGLLRAALQLRYRLLPYHYSLARAMFEQRRLWMRPMAMALGQDPMAASLSTQWMDGSLLVAPVLNEDSQRRAYLPKGEWCVFNSSRRLRGPLQLAGRAPLHEVPVFAAPGTLLPLAPASLQSSEALPGGPLELHIYGGADGAFELLEDDGASRAYEAGEGRRTAFTWSEADRTLAWAAEGEAPHSAFEEFFVRLFEERGTLQSPVRPLGRAGSLSFPRQE